jgi:UDP-2,3-diacylglucosamine pyrophosphatase LpxH
MEKHMKRTVSSPLDARSLMLGVTLGAGAALAAVSYFRHRPEQELQQRLVNQALDRTYARLADAARTRLAPNHRYVIFSDHHKGNRNKADDFRFCEQTYLAALDYYAEQGHTLIVLGDAEELLEEQMANVMTAYENVFRAEARFHPDRLMRVYGNHDIAWKVQSEVGQGMERYFPHVTYTEGILFEYAQDNRVLGEIFLVHGYQGSLESDVFGFVPKYILPYYRDFQILTGFGTTSPSRDAYLRSEVDNRLYRWVSQKKKLIMICGHTHRPVWSSKTHLEKLIEELYDLLRLPAEKRPLDYVRLVEEKKCEVEAKQAKYPPCNDIIKTRPAYFNAGCCRYNDGDITGIELEDGTLRLVKWGLADEGYVRTVFEENPLEELFLYL